MIYCDVWLVRSYFLYFKILLLRTKKYEINGTKVKLLSNCIKTKRIVVKQLYSKNLKSMKTLLTKQNAIFPNGQAHV